MRRWHKCRYQNNNRTPDGRHAVALVMHDNRPPAAPGLRRQFPVFLMVLFVVVGKEAVPVAGPSEVFLQNGRREEDAAFPPGRTTAAAVLPPPPPVPPRRKCRRADALAQLRRGRSVESATGRSKACSSRPSPVALARKLLPPSARSSLVIGVLGVLSHKKN